MVDLFAIELFPCSGGMAEGFRRAGVTFAMAFDKDRDACDSYEANHAHRPIQMDVCDLLRMVGAGWRPAAQIDLLVADPPCTPWSRAGKRQGVADERDMLVETCDLIALLRPRAYLIGNVPGLDDGPQWRHVQQHIGGLARAGYCVADYAQLDAADYGVPQHRVRPFWFGHLEGPCVRWPAPTHGDPAAGLALPGMALKPWVTCREALCHLPAEELGRPVRLRWREDCHPPSRVDAPANVVPASMPGNGGATLAFGPNHRPSRADVPARTLTRNTHSDGALLALPQDRRQGMRVGTPDEPGAVVTAKPSRVGAGEGHVLEWPWDRPSTTVFAGTAQTGGPGKGSPGNRPNAVVLSEKAAAILQGFPPGWVFAGKTKRARWSQLGQAMPPGLAEPVARAIVEQMARARGREAAA